MCSPSVVEFGERSLASEEVGGKQVLEVGSLNVNGSLRDSVERLGPSKYIGVDMISGPGVDEICDIGELVSRFGADSFDVVICTEVLEHVRDWRLAVSNLKNVLKPDGVLIATTRSRPFGYHGYPHDFWRYEVDDFRAIFADLAVEAVEKDPWAPGVMLKARKPRDFQESDLREHELFSVVTDKVSRDVSDLDIARFRIARKCEPVISRVLPPRFRRRVRYLVRKQVARVLPRGLKTFLRRHVLREDELD